MTNFIYGCLETWSGSTSPHAQITYEACLCVHVNSMLCHGVWVAIMLRYDYRRPCSLASISRGQLHPWILLLPNRSQRWVCAWCCQVSFINHRKLCSCSRKERMLCCIFIFTTVVKQAGENSLFRFYTVCGYLAAARNFRWSVVFHLSQCISWHCKSTKSCQMITDRCVFSISLFAWKTLKCLSDLEALVKVSLSFEPWLYYIYDLRIKSACEWCYTFSFQLLLSPAISCWKMMTMQAAGM